MTQELSDDYCYTKIKELGIAIRNKEDRATSLFLACYETFPRHVWSQSVKMGLLTPRQLQACTIILKLYRRQQAIAAIEQV